MHTAQARDILNCGRVLRFERFVQPGRDKRLRIDLSRFSHEPIIRCPEMKHVPGRAVGAIGYAFYSLPCDLLPDHVVSHPVPSVRAGTVRSTPRALVERRVAQERSPYGPHD